MPNAVEKQIDLASTEPRIQLLPEFIVNQISAGEVVDRPASVVRELLDNSLDAGATDIVVSVEDGGRKLIKVVDNGHGMSRENALMAFENHATSKVSNLSDLSGIKTFGFRGEALASIAAVSKVELRTRSGSSEVGTRVQIEGGKIVKVESCACNIGTEFSVRSLFFNTPARRKFLKRPETEESKIKQWIIQSAAPNFSIRYRYYVDGREVINYPSVSNMEERTRSFVKGSLNEISWSKGETSISGLIGHPGAASTSSSSLVTIINKRVVKDGLVLKAVREGFASMLKSYESPVGVISIDLPSTQVDVNVHPQKSEVRFLNSGEIFVNVREAISEAVKEFRAPIDVYVEQNSSQIYRAPHSSNPLPERRDYELKQSSLSYGVSAQPVAEVQYNSVVTAQPTLDRPPIKNSFRYEELRYIGQLFECYLLCEKDSGFYVLDMHAAHERCNFNLIREGFLAGSVPEQILLIPVIVRLGPESLDNLVSHSSILKRWGFEIDQFGPDAVAVRSAPSFVKQEDVLPLITEISEEEIPEASDSLLKEHIDHIAARIACHGSIRSGKIMSKDEAYQLLKLLDRAEMAGACPHGRPVMVNFPLSIVERWFGRDK